LISTPNGATIPLSSLAKVSFREGPGMVRDENAMPVGYVFVDVDGSRDVGSYVKDAKARVESSVKVPPGYFISWSGQFENMERVKERLKIVIPLALLIIVFLLHFNTGSWIKSGIVLLAIPFSLIGAIWFMWALGYHSSVATWVGMIALLGLDAETGVYMLMYLDLAYEDRKKSGQMNSEEDLTEGIVEGAVHRIRPKLMTVSALMLGLTPILWSTGAGSDVMRRIAAPMIGGLVTSFILELLIYPVLFYRWKLPLLRRR
jgi:Cu(I)/Ag(I) efflux system membrane protein CusA/SilA